MEANLNSTNISKASLDEVEDVQQSNEDFKRGNLKSPNIEIDEKKQISGDFKVIGYSSLNAMSDFVNGTYKVIEGEIIDIESSNKECLISQDLADENSLGVGSTVLLVNPNNEEEKYEFIVKGIYSDSSDNEEFSMFSNSANQILTSYNTLNDIVEISNKNEESKLTTNINSKFILENENVIEAFKNELQEKGLDDSYEFTTNLESLNENLKPIENLSTFASVFLLIVLLIGIVVLIVINMINIRERKYEIGVLRSIGMKKHLVLLQFVIEIFIATIISVMIGTIIGSVLTVPVSETMLKSEIESLNNSNKKINENFGMNEDMNFRDNNMVKMGDIRQTFGDNNAKYIDKLNIVLDYKTILQLFLISILITIVSSSISMAYISKYTPLKILSNRT